MQILNSVYLSDLTRKRNPENLASYSFMVVWLFVPVVI